ncbi:MAG: hypothetical protein GXZ04_05045 [Clostridiales bacterium]|nr:hypothetical protein [Clostridiales bacterium]
MVTPRIRTPLLFVMALVMLLGLLPGVSLAQQVEAAAYPGFKLIEQSQFTLVNAGPPCMSMRRPGPSCL